MPKCMSALAYRISAVLFHAGVGFDDIKRVNRMGVCMSPYSLVNLQRKMGESFEAKVYEWKEAIERNRTTLAFLEEVQEKQVPKFDFDDMVIETQVDLTEDTVKGYPFYQPEILQNASKIINNIQHQCQDKNVTERRTSSFIQVSLNFVPRL